MKVLNFGSLNIDYVYSVEKNFPLELLTGIKLEIASATSIGRSDSMMSTP